MNERPVGEMLTCLLFGAVGAFCLWVAVHIFLRGEMVFSTNSGRVTYVAGGSASGTIHAGNAMRTRGVWLLSGRSPESSGAV